MYRKFTICDGIVVTHDIALKSDNNLMNGDKG